jgi:hypothetical protein
MIKAITPGVTLAAAVMFGVETYYMQQTFIIVVICTGVIIASIGEMKWDTIGVICQVSALHLRNVMVNMSPVTGLVSCC